MLNQNEIKIICSVLLKIYLSNKISTVATIFVRSFEQHINMERLSKKESKYKKDK